MMASLLTGKALGSAEKMDSAFELGNGCECPLLPEFDGPEIRGRCALVTTVSSEETSEADPWGKNERCEAGTLRASSMASRDAIDDEELDL